MGVGDRVGFYLLPRSRARSSTPSSTCSQSRFPPIDTKQSSEEFASTSGRVGRIRTREEKKQPSPVEDIQNIEQRSTTENLLPQRPRTRINRLSKEDSKSPEVLFDSTPLYLPSDPTGKSQVNHLPSNKAKSGKVNVGQQQSSKQKGQRIKNPSEFLIEKSNSMLSKRSGQKESEANLEDKVYQETLEDKSGELFRSISPGTGDIHNMRIHAGIMIDTQSSRRREEGRYNSSRLNFIIIYLTFVRRCNTT